MNKLIRIIYLGLILILPYVAIAQTGPMGIGNANGSNGQQQLLLWLACDSVEVSGGYVDTWYDKSGNERNFTATGSNRPTFHATGGPSGKAFIQFDGIDDRMSSSGFPLSGNGYSVYFIYKSNDSKFGMFSYASAAHEHEVLIHYDGGFYQKHRASEVALSTLGTTNNSWTYGGLIWSRSSPTAGSQYTPSTQSETPNAGLIAAIPNGSGEVVIGDIQNSLGFQPGDAFEGDIAEIIVFKGPLTKGNARMMRTYLWTKYGESPAWRNSNPGWDKFKAYASGSNAQYDKVIGIARDNTAPVPGGQPESRLEGLVLRVSPDMNTYNSGTYLCAALGSDVGNSIVTTDLPVGVERRWDRVWEIASPYTGSSQVLVSFDFGEGINGDIPQNPENYVLLRRANNSGTFQVVGGILEQYVLDDEIIFRVNQSSLSWSSTNKWHYTIGTTNHAQSSLNGAPFRTWYCIGTNQNNHYWDQPSRWTLDGSTNPIYINPNEEIPQPGDNVVIGSGRAIMLNIDNLTGIGRLTVNGTLNIGTAATPEFLAIAGNGRIRCAGNSGVGNFPIGNTTEFADPSTGGTVEFYSTMAGGGYTQTTASSSDIILINNLIINMNQVAHEITLAANLTHNGTFNLTRGTVIINDGSNLSRTISSHGRVAVTADGIIKVSDANSPGSNPNPRGKHRWFFNDDLYNLGHLIFTNRTAPDYSNGESQHWIEAHFTNGVKNQTLTANGSINRLSRIIVNKYLSSYFKCSANYYT